MTTISNNNTCQFTDNKTDKKSKSIDYRIEQRDVQIKCRDVNSRDNTNSDNID